MIASERIFLGLGSNRGDSRRILREACAALEAGLSGLRSSSLWLSEPRYVLDQPPYFNLVLEGDCALSPGDLLDFTSSIEAKFGRDRSKERPKGPRSLDIDILLFGDKLLESDRLCLPHPGMEERKFVLLPLLELVPELRSPRTGKPYIESLAGLEPQGIYLAAPGDYDPHYS